jgi:serine-type D-Ala-D-Ala carboxypeptidase/endopeptidase
VIEKRLADAEAPACAAVAVIGAGVETHFPCHPEAAGRLEGTSIVEIGSITKGVTGLLLADMVVRGETSLEETVSGRGPQGVALPALDGITLRELATHRSGLPRLPARFAPAVPGNPYAGFDVAALYTALAQTSPRARGVYEYSNLGFMWLSDVLARIGGKPFEALLRERVLGPLGMADTAITLSGEQQARFAPGHGKKYKPVSRWDMSPDLAGAGGLRSTLDDMTKLARALIRPEETALEAAIALALEPTAPANNENAMGLGWHILRAAGKRIAWHNGATGGFRSMLAANVHAGSASVVLADSGAVDLDDLALHLVDRNFKLRRRRFGFLRWW